MTSPPDPASAPEVLGVLGGIASGKSRVAELLAGPGGTVVDADRIAHEVLASEEVRGRIRERFGPDVFDADGELVRAELGRRVFASEADRKALEAWTHPRVRATISARIAEARAARRLPIVLDVPLLLENDAEHGLASLCDALVLVDSDPDERDRRARDRRGWAPGEVARREAHQIPLDEKRRRATHVLSNRTSERELEASAEALRRALGLA